VKLNCSISAKHTKAEKECKWRY